MHSTLESLSSTLQCICVLALCSAICVSCTLQCKCASCTLQCICVSCTLQCILCVSCTLQCICVSCTLQCICAFGDSCTLKSTMSTQYLVLKSSWLDHARAKQAPLHWCQLAPVHWALHVPEQQNWIWSYLIFNTHFRSVCITLASNHVFAAAACRNIFSPTAQKLLELPHVVQSSENLACLMSSM